MAAYVKTLKSGNDIIYPQTKTSGVFDENNVNLQTVLGDMNTSIQTLSGQSFYSIFTTTVVLLVADWSNNTQTESISAVTENSHIIVSPMSTSTNINNYIAAGIICSSQTNGSLTFTCTTTPSSAIHVNVMVINRRYL